MTVALLFNYWYFDWFVVLLQMYEIYGSYL